MNKIKRKHKKLTFLIVLIVLTFIVTSIPKNNITVFASNYSEESLCNNQILDDDYEDDNVIVVLNSKVSKINKIHNSKFFKGIEIESITDLTKRDYNFKSKNDFKQILQIYLKEKGKDNVLNAISYLETLDGVYSAEPNYILENTVEPDDPNYIDNKLWGLNGTNGIDVENAWNYTTGSNTIRVGIIDTGISNHVDLNANLVPGRDTFNNNNITNDDTHSHGTHVAGTIGAVGNNGTGVVGVNWNVTLVPLQASNSDNKFYSSDVVEAIEWAQDRWETEERISIINYSVSGFGSSTAVRTAISEYDGLFIWAAGNDTVDIDERVEIYGSFNLDNIISVGGLNSDGTRRPTSNYSTNNTNVHIYAPGTSIYSTVPTSFSSSGYSYKSGTSMAAPHVTGVAALLLSLNNELTTSQLKQAILESANEITISIPDNSEEADVGDMIEQVVLKLNAYNAVKYVLNNYSETVTLNYDTKSLSKSVDSSSTFFNEKNYFLKLDVNNPFEYDFTISSSNLIEITLYDSSFNEIDITITQTNGGLTNQFAYYLSYGSYYLKVNFTNENTNGIITTTIVGEHYHSPSLWMYYSRISHRGRCSCGEWVEKPHVVNISEVVNYQAECLECHAMLDLRYDVATGGINNRKVSINGSYILPNGIIVLVEEDIEAYFAGTLTFYEEDETLVTQ